MRMVVENDIKTSSSISLLNESHVSAQAERVPMASLFSPLFQAVSVEDQGMHASKHTVPRIWVKITRCCKNYFIPCSQE